MANHTPGPWAVEEGQILAQDTVLGQVYGADDYPCMDPGEDDVEGLAGECHANAALIAAAPDGNAILRELAEWFANGRGPSPHSLFDDRRTWADALRDYFARAEGGR